MFPELHAIERVCSRTPGSIKRIVLIDPDDLASQPDWHLLPSIATLSFLPGKAAYDFQDDRLTARLEDTTEDAPAGDFFQYTLTARLRTVRAEVELLRAKTVNRRLHVIATYYNDEQRFLPDMRLRFRADSADRPAGRNGYQVTGVCRLAKPAPFLDAVVDVIGGPYVPPDTPPTSINGVTLVEITTSDSSYVYEIAAGFLLLGWEVTGTTAQTVALGTTAGGEQLGGPVTLGIAETWVGTGINLPSENLINIYFSGLTGTNTIKIWLLG